MKKYFTLVTLCVTIWLTGCQKNNTPDPQPVDTDPKTFIMFGKISGFAGNVTDAQTAVGNGALKKGQRLLVYYDKSSGNELYELVQDSSQPQGFRKDVIKTYDRDVSSLDPGRMRTILEDAMAAAPANHYALSLGTHGTGWVHCELGLNTVPQQVRELYRPLLEIKDAAAQTRNVNHEMDIHELSPILEGLGFDFIILDQCLMGGIEVVYQMRDTAPYLIVSPAEIMMTGFPFQRIIPVIFSDWGNLESVCDQFISHYSSYSYPCATISVVKTSELEALRESVKAIVANGVNGVGQDGLQYFYSTGGVSGIFYDLGQYIRELSTSDPLTRIFESQLQKAVPYTRTTGKYYPSNVIAEDCYSGLTTYVPDPAAYPVFYESYQKTAWYRDISGK